MDIKKIAISMNAQKTISQKESMLKLANEVERFNQVQMWGYNVIDIIHSVRRAQAINSSIKEAGLKYITKYIDAEAKDRIYIDHTKIGSMYANKEEYWLNTDNGNYKKVGIDGVNVGVFVTVGVWVTVGVTVGLGVCVCDKTGNGDWVGSGVGNGVTQQLKFKL